MIRKLNQRRWCGARVVIAAMPMLLATLLASDATAADAIKPEGAPTTVRGLVRPLQQASIAVELPVRVAKIAVREAQAFNKSDTIIIFDCERPEAEVAAADAVSREMALVLESSTYLQKRGAVGSHDVEIARARAAKASAEAKALKSKLKDCRIVAPFNGRVSELTLNEHETPQPGKPFLVLVDETNFEIDLIVPSKWLRTLKAGTKFNFEIDETARSYAAHILRIGAVVDPVSQTVKAIAGFERADERVQAGMSGTANFGDRASDQ